MPASFFAVDICFLYVWFLKEATILNDNAPSKKVERCEEDRRLRDKVSTRSTFRTFLGWRGR